MTFGDESPGKDGVPFFELRKKCIQKRHLVCSLIVAVIVPFVALRLLVFYEFAPSFGEEYSSSPVSALAQSVLHRPDEITLNDDQAPSAATEPEDTLGPVIRPDADAWLTHDPWMSNPGRKNETSTESGNPQDEERTPTKSPTPHDAVEDFKLPDEQRNQEPWMDERRSPHDNEKTSPITSTQVVDEQRLRDEEKNAEEEKREKEDEEKAEEEKRAKEVEEKKAEKEKRAKEDEEKKAEEEKRAKEDEEKKAEEEKRAKEDEDKKAEEEKRQRDEEEKADEEKIRKDEEKKAEEEKRQRDEEKNVEEEKAANELRDREGKKSVPIEVCDLFDGDWEHDPEGPMYTNVTCSHIEGQENCIRNGRPDTEYLHWKWKPRHCELPRFDAWAFLEKFRGKSLCFVGDSLVRNQFHSLLCILAQVEQPVQTPDDRSTTWSFPNHRVFLDLKWSPYLLKESVDGLFGFNRGQSVLQLDVLDTEWTTELSKYDVLVLSVGQWYFKPVVFVHANQVVGCHYCPDLNLTDLGFYEPYRSGVRYVLDSIVKDYKGIVIMSTFAISHYDKGEYDHEYCRRVLPLSQEEANRWPGYHFGMREIVMEEFYRVSNDSSKFRDDLKWDFLDVTTVALRRADGHPGPYRIPNPYETLSPDTWVLNDCLHWCLPGTVDTWNQLLVQILSRHL